MKKAQLRTISILLTLALCIGFSPAMAADVSEDLESPVATWDISLNASAHVTASLCQTQAEPAEYRLDLQGDGPTANYQAATQPWAAYRDSITEITVGPGIVYLGTFLFTDCKNLRTATIGEGVGEIAAQAFKGCSSLVDLSLPDSLGTIRSYAFYDCAALETVYLPLNLSRLENRSFGNCTSLKKIVFRQSPDLNLVISSGTFYSQAKIDTIIIGDNPSLQTYAWSSDNRNLIIPVESIVLTYDSLAMEVGDTITLDYSFLPVDATDQNVLWASSNDAIASIDSNGTVMALAVGEAAITISTTNGTIYDQCMVKVESAQKPLPAGRQVHCPFDPTTAWIAPYGDQSRGNSETRLAAIDDGKIYTYSPGGTWTLWRDYSVYDYSYFYFHSIGDGTLLLAGQFGDIIDNGIHDKIEYMHHLFGIDTQPNIDVTILETMVYDHTNGYFYSIGRNIYQSNSYENIENGLSNLLYHSYDRKTFSQPNGQILPMGDTLLLVKGSHGNSEFVYTSDYNYWDSLLFTKGLVMPALEYASNEGKPEYIYALYWGDNGLSKYYFAKRNPDQYLDWPNIIQFPSWTEVECNIPNLNNIPIAGQQSSFFYQGTTDPETYELVSINTLWQLKQGDFNSFELPEGTQGLFVGYNTPELWIIDKTGSTMAYNLEDFFD